MAKQINYSDIFKMLSQINRLAKSLDAHFVVILDFQYFEFWLSGSSRYLFRTSDVDLFYQKMNDFYRIGLWTMVFDSANKIPSNF